MNNLTRQSASDERPSRLRVAHRPRRPARPRPCGGAGRVRGARRALSAAHIRAFLVVALFALFALNNVAMWFLPAAREPFGMLRDVLLLVIGFYFGDKVGKAAGH